MYIDPVWSKFHHFDKGFYKLLWTKGKYVQCKFKNERSNKLNWFSKGLPACSSFPDCDELMWQQKRQKKQKSRSLLVLSHLISANCAIKSFPRGAKPLVKIKQLRPGFHTLKKMFQFVVCNMCQTSLLCFAILANYIFVRVSFNFKIILYVARRKQSS